LDYSPKEEARKKEEEGDCRDSHGGMTWVWEIGWGGSVHCARNAGALPIDS